MVFGISFLIPIILYAVGVLPKSSLFLGIGVAFGYMLHILQKMIAFDELLNEEIQEEVEEKTTESVQQEIDDQVEDQVSKEVQDQVPQEVEKEVNEQIEYTEES